MQSKSRQPTTSNIQWLLKLCTWMHACTCTHTHIYKCIQICYTTKLCKFKKLPLGIILAEPNGGVGNRVEPGYGCGAVPVR